jgi:hypothetical protein
MFLNDLPQNNQKMKLALNNAQRTSICTILTRSLVALSADTLIPSGRNKPRSQLRKNLTVTTVEIYSKFRLYRT